MFGGSNQPYWPGMHTQQPAQNQGGRETLQLDEDPYSVDALLHKEHEMLAGSQMSIDAAGGIREDAGGHTSLSSRCGAGEEAGQMGTDLLRSDGKSKPGSGNLAVVAVVTILGFGGFMLGQLVASAAQKFAPSRESVRIVKPKTESEYAETIRRYRAYVQSEQNQEDEGGQGAGKSGFAPTTDAVGIDEQRAD